MNPGTEVRPLFERLSGVEDMALQWLLLFGIRIVGALVLWFVGGWLIRILLRVVRKAFALRSVDETLARYADAAINVSLRIALVIAILGLFGIETTTFAALVAAAGVAIGAAWAGLLSNFAAGVFLLVMRPFRVGDTITAAGAQGQVREIGLFATTLDTGENLRVIVGNTKLFSDNIVNHTANSWRRADVRLQLGHGVDLTRALEAIRGAVAGVANVLADPAPTVDVVETSASGTVIAVKPCCRFGHHGQVVSDTHQLLQRLVAEHRWPAPATVQIVREAAA
jgi:small conductance mechanosensitive channel